MSKEEEGKKNKKKQTKKGDQYQSSGYCMALREVPRLAFRILINGAAHESWKMHGFIPEYTQYHPTLELMTPAYACIAPPFEQYQVGLTLSCSS